MELRREHDAYDFAGELRQVRHAAHLVHEELHLFGPGDVYGVFIREQCHPRREPATHGEPAVVVVAPQQVGHLQRALHIKQLAAHHGVVHARVAQYDQVRGAIGVVAGECAVDLQMAFDQDQKGLARGSLVGVVAVLQQRPQRAAAGQGRIQVQLGHLRIAGEAEHGFRGQRIRVLCKALGDPAVGGQSGGHIGQRAKSGSGHGAAGRWNNGRGIVHRAPCGFCFARRMMCCLINCPP